MRGKKCEAVWGRSGDLGLPTVSSTRQPENVHTKEKRPSKTPAEEEGIRGKTSSGATEGKGVKTKTEKERWEEVIQRSKIKIATMNINSAVNKTIELQVICDADDVDVLALTETYFNKRSIELEGYKCVTHDDRQDTNDGKCGGAAIFVKADLVALTKVIPIKKPKQVCNGEEINVQVCAIELMDRLITVLYRPPINNCWF